MFRYIYKAANDDIKPHPYLLAKILNKSAQKKKRVFLRYGYGLVAAAIALAIAIPSFIYIPNDNTTLEIPQNQSDSYILSNDNSPTTRSQPPAEMPAETNRSTPIIATEEIKQPIPESEPKYIPHAEVKQVASEATYIMSVNDISADTFVASSISSLDSAILNIEELTAKEYFERIGFYPELLEIPQNLTADFSSETIVIAGQNNTFTYSGENFLSITVMASSDEAMSYINNAEYEKSTFGNKSAVVLNDGFMYSAYIVHSSGTGIKIETNLPEEDLKNLLISACK